MVKAIVSYALLSMSLGYDALFQSQEGIQLPREIKADQYGVRFPVVVDDTVIKFEIIAEARIDLDAPIYFDLGVVAPTCR